MKSLAVGKFVLAALVLASIRLAAQVDSSISPVNLGSAINSIYEEVLPVISPDGKTLYFDRTDHPDNYGHDDIWYSTLQPDGTWSQAVNMGRPLNNAENNFVCSVTPDGNTLLLGNVYDSNGRMSPGVSIVHRTRDGWGRPQKLEIQNFYSRGMVGNYSLANDGKSLLLSIERDDSYGGMDIYVSFLQPSGYWSTPKNLGPDINSRKSDRTPFLASDGVTLYFASEGHGGLGSSDIFVARRLDSTWTNWSRPQNLGKPINTKGWDGFFTITASGDYAYFVSGENSIGGNDIFRVPLSQAMRPKAVVLISGRVLEAKSQQPVEATIIYERLEDGAAVGSARSNPSTGEYQIALPAGTNYGFRAEAPGFIPVNDNIDLTELEKYQEISRDLYLVPFEVGAAIRLNNVFFDVGKAELHPESYPELNRIVKLLRDNPNLHVEIAGHTDNVGKDESNLRLSELRAQAVESYLELSSVSKDQLVVKGYGETEPIDTNDTDDGRRRNRRVEFKILSK